MAKQMIYIEDQQPEIGREIVAWYANGSRVVGTHTEDEPEHTTLAYWRYLTDEELKKQNNGIHNSMA